MNEQRKELWDRAIEEIDDKYIEETAQTIIKKSGKPVQFTEIIVEKPDGSDEKKNDSRFRRALPVALASAAALGIVAGSGYLLRTYDISMGSTQDGKEQTTTSVSHTTTRLEIGDDGEVIVVEENDPEKDETADDYAVKTVNFDSYSVDLFYEYGDTPLENMVIKCREKAGTEYFCEYETGISAADIDTDVLHLFGYELMSGDVLSLWTEWNEGEYVVYLYDCSLNEIKPMKTNIGAEYEDVFNSPSISADPTYDYLYIYESGEAKQAYSVDFKSSTLTEAELFEMDKRTDFLNIIKADFEEPLIGMEYPFAGNWKPAFSNKIDRIYNLNWNFDIVPEVASFGNYWYFKENSVITDEYIYVMPKSNDKYIYQYYYNGNTDQQFCDYFRVLERNDSPPVVDNNKIERYLNAGEEYIIKLNYSYDGSEAVLSLSKADGTGEAVSLNTGIVPEKVGNVTPDLYILTTANGKVIVVNEPYYLAEGGVGYRRYFFNVTGGKIYQFIDQNLIPVIIDDKEGVGIGALWSADAIYTNLVYGQPRTYYHIDYDNIRILEMGMYFDEDTNTEPLAWRSKNFVPITNDAVNRYFEGDWEVVFGGNWCSEGTTFNFSKAESEIITYNACYCTNIENGPVNDSGPVIYAIFYSNPDYMYAYETTADNDNILICNYSYIFKRVPSEEIDQILIVDLDDYRFVMQINENKPIKLRVRSNEGDKLLAELDTEIMPAEFGETVTRCGTINFEDNILGTLFVPENTENGIYYRNYFYCISENAITPITDVNGYAYSTLTRGYSRDVYYDKQAVWYQETAQTLGDNKVYYCFDFDKHTVTEKQLFEADTDLTPVNYSSLKFEEWDKDTENPFMGVWEYPCKTISDAPFVITENVMVAETDKAYYFNRISGGIPSLLCIMKDNPDYMYEYIRNCTIDSCAHSDYSIVYKRSDVPVGESFITKNLSTSFARLGYISGLTVKLTSLQNFYMNEVLAEIPLDFEYEQNTGSKPYFEVYEFIDGEIAAIFVPNEKMQYDVHLYNIKRDKIEEITAYNADGKKIQLIAWFQTLRDIEAENNSFVTSWCEVSDDLVLMYAETFERYEIDFENSTAKLTALSPYETNTSKMTTDFTPADDPVKIIDEVLHGEWTLEYNFEDPDSLNPGSYMTLYNTLVFNYNGRCSDYPHNCLTQVICENDEAWYCTGENGTFSTIIYIPKDDPDTLYYYHSERKDLRMNQYQYIYKRKEVGIDTPNNDTINDVPTNLSPLGIMKIKEMTGYDIFSTPEILTDAQGGKWSTAEVDDCGTGDIFLTKLSDNSITYCIRAYPEGKEMISYGNEHVFPIVDYSSFIYLTVTATKSNGKWSITEVLNKYGIELHELCLGLEREYNGIYEAVIGYIIPNYLNDDFWDESINPEKSRITADAIVKLREELHSEQDTQLIGYTLADGQLVYSMCHNSYWS